MLLRLRHPPIVGGDNKQGEVNGSTPATMFFTKSSWPRTSTIPRRNESGTPATADPVSEAGSIVILAASGRRSDGASQGFDERALADDDMARQWRRWGCASDIDIGAAEAARSALATSASCRGK